MRKCSRPGVIGCFCRQLNKLMRTTRFVDLDAAFTAHPETGDVSVKTDERAIKFAVKSLVMTNYFERPFRSEIGSPIRQLLFDNIGPNFSILMQRAITDVITNFEPRVDVLNVDVNAQPDNNSVDIRITFRIKNTERPLDVSVTLERTR